MKRFLSILLSSGLILGFTFEGGGGEICMPKVLQSEVS